MTNSAGWDPTSVHRVQLTMKFSKIYKTLNFLPMRFQGNRSFCAICYRANLVCGLIVFLADGLVVARCGHRDGV